MFELNREKLCLTEGVLCDGGYTGEKFAESVKTILGATVEIVKRSELHTFVVLPKRWVVERSFGWLDKCRRLWKNCERKLNATRDCFSGLMLPEPPDGCFGFSGIIAPKILNRLLRTRFDTRFLTRPVDNSAAYNRRLSPKVLRKSIILRKPKNRNKKNPVGGLTKAPSLW
jgi:hypothetical protein